MFFILNYCSSYWYVNVKVTTVLGLPLIIKCTWWWCTTVLSVCFFPQQCPVVIITIIIMFTQLSVFWDWKLPHHNTTHQNIQCNLECTLLWPHNNDFNRKNTVGTKSSNVHAALIAAANVLLLPLSSAVCPPLSLSPSLEPSHQPTLTPCSLQQHNQTAGAPKTKEIPTNSTVGGDSPSFGVVAEKLQLPLGGLPCRVLLPYAWKTNTQTHTHTQRITRLPLTFVVHSFLFMLSKKHVLARAGFLLYKSLTDDN